MYKSKETKNILAELYGWRDYGEKHEESIFTWWFQSYYLFEKFGIDKRKAHYSSLINSGQMTRSKALALLGERPIYPFLGIESKVLKYPKRSYKDFPTNEHLFNAISYIVKNIRKLQWKS